MILSSPLKRAAQSAEIIAKYRKVPIIYKDSLKERDFGRLAGWKINDLPGLDKTKSDIGEQLKTVDVRTYGGESEEDMKKRVKELIEGLKSEYNGKTILIVGHAGVMYYMHQVFPQKERREFANASIHEFLIE
ncbi:MAG TPA: histidine phosphatase family protein [Candidatus Nanoarchaeia archaeon]|nr:histidine phosphatase family protein [Candidatus Nanoarchaeia archaeon]